VKKKKSKRRSRKKKGLKGVLQNSLGRVGRRSAEGLTRVSGGRRETGKRKREGTAREDRYKRELA